MSAPTSDLPFVPNVAVPDPRDRSNVTVGQDVQPLKEAQSKRTPLDRSRALLRRAQRLIEEKYPDVKKFDPVVFMLMVAADPTMKTSDRLRAAIASAPYFHPSLKSIEISGAGGGPIKVETTGQKDRLAKMVGMEPVDVPFTEIPAAPLEPIIEAVARAES